MRMPPGWFPRPCRESRCARWRRPIARSPLRNGATGSRKQTRSLKWSAMKRLLDTNTWIALTVETHRHHATARQWYDEAPLTPGDLVFCLPTELGFLRLITQTAVMN